MSTIKETLLKLDSREKSERRKVEVDYYFYRGACEDRDIALKKPSYWGQNWEEKDDVDYIPTQDIRNKVKPLLRKQARWMFSKEPDILIIPADKKQKETAEELRKFIDDTLRKNLFWKKTRQAFLMSTIKKRVMLRAAAGQGKLNLRYEDIENFSYKEIDGQVMEARFFQEDLNNVYHENEEDKKIYYIHKFYYKKVEENEPEKAVYCKQKFNGSDLLNPIEEQEQEIGFDINKIPVWLIKNGGELGEEFGETDLHDLKPIQNQYNKTISDAADAIKFGLFGTENVVDGNEDDVNKFEVAPGALRAIHTDAQALTEGKQATISKSEYSLTGINAVETYLDRAEKDMNFILDMPSLDDMNNIPSAKAMRYLYNDLIARCEEKWNDWGPVLEEVIRYIISIAQEAKLPGFNPKWNDLEFTLIFNHNYPIPSDEEEKKTIAISEVSNKVRSVKSYLKEFSDEDDFVGAYREILKEQSEFAGAEMSEFATANYSDDDSDTKKDGIKNMEEEDEKARDLDDE